MLCLAVTYCYIFLASSFCAQINSVVDRLSTVFVDFSLSTCKVVSRPAGVKHKKAAWFIDNEI